MTDPVTDLEINAKAQLVLLESVRNRPGHNRIPQGKSMETLIPTG